MLATVTDTELDEWVATVAERPTWDETWATIGNEEMLTAKALIELSTALRGDAAQFLRYHERRYLPEGADWDYDGPAEVERGGPEFAWDEWLADYDERGRGWHSTADRLFQVVASLLDRERPMRGFYYLGGGYLGDWETDVWRILTEWGTGGNNRDLPGRATVVKRP